MAPPTGFFIVDGAPGPLAGMPYPPPDTDWSALAALGFHRLVRLHPGDYDSSPLLAEEIELEDLFGGRLPLDPETERGRILQAADVVAGHLRRGEGVVVHCVGGTGRTGTVLACALRALGTPAAEAIRAVREQRPHWPESPWHEEVVRRAR